MSRPAPTYATESRSALASGNATAAAALNAPRAAILSCQKKKKGSALLKLTLTLVVYDFNEVIFLSSFSSSVIVMFLNFLKKLK